MTQTDLNTQWNLQDLYAGMDDPKIEADHKAAGELVEELKAYRDKVPSLSSDELLKLIHTKEELYKKLHRIGAFAGLLESTHVGDAEVTRFSKKMDERMIELQKEIIFIEVEFTRVDEKKWHEWLSALQLKEYELTLMHYQKEAKHVLTEAEEKVLAETSQTGWQALSHLFSITTNTLCMQWDDKQITLEEALTKLRDPDATTRKKAAMAIHTALKTNDKTTPAIFNSLVQDKSIRDRLRKYEYPEQSRLEGEDVDKATVDALISAVNESSTIVERYYALKKQILKTDQLYWWDRYAPLPKPIITISTDEAKQMVLDAFHAFSPEVHKIAEGMFEKRHIDWMPSETKRGGAFCQFGAYGEYPYVLLNFTSDLNDVMTLAHELGHAVHDVLAQDNNNWMNVWAPLAEAEIASTFAEMLLFDRLIESKDITKEDRIALLMGAIEDNFATVHRQIAMYEFERSIHVKRREEGELSKEQIDELWHEHIKKPFGDSLTWTDEHKNYWMYVSHIFNSPFYVYSYAFAQLCTLAIYQQYKEKGADFVPTYLQLLKTGGSKTPKDNLAQAGLDIDKPEFWSNGLAIISKYVDQLEAELK
jgi:oligoendopeptidase F